MVKTKKYRKRVNKSKKRGGDCPCNKRRNNSTWSLWGGSNLQNGYEKRIIPL
jgi:hypothetical protein